ncbi:unnamed protein product [Rotaria magnacalcarata]
MRPPPLSSTVIINPQSGTITATNLAISEVGAYIIKLDITTSNNQYSIPFTSNCIIVKENSTTLNAITSSPSSNITYQGDYDKFVTAGTLENLHCTIYNYLTVVKKLPLNTNIILAKGSVNVFYGMDTSASANRSQISSGCSELASDPNGINDLVLSNLTCAGTQYTVKSSSISSSSSSSSITASNAGLIAGVVVGVCAALALLAAATYSAYKYKKLPSSKVAGQFNELYEPLERPQLGNAATTNPSNIANSSSQQTRPLSGQSHFNDQRVHTPVQDGGIVTPKCELIDFP